MSLNPLSRNPFLLRRVMAVLICVMSLSLTPAQASERRAPAIRWTSAVDAHARGHGFSGTILVAKGDRPAYLKSFGMADRAFSVPARNDTRYRVASITKLFTAVLVMKLVDEGKLDLSAPIGRYLPRYPGEGADRITIHHLLNHTSGIAQFDRVASLEQALTEGVPYYQRPQTAESLLHYCCAGPLAHPPGARFDYNNADYVVLGRIVEAVTGNSYEAALEARILRPLGLANSGIARQDLIIPRLAPSYYWRGVKAGWMNDLPIYHQNSDAAGSLYSTAGDLLTFADALYGGRLIGRRSLAKLLQPGLDDYGYGLWSYSITRGGRARRVAKRPGSIMGANAQLYRLVDDGITIIILANTNRADLDVFAQKIADAVLQ